MADHRAEQILDAVVTSLTGLSTTGSNIFRGRHYSLESGSMPALLVYMGSDEPIEMLSQSLIDSLIEVRVESRTMSPTAQLDESLNQIRKEVTIALQADFSQGLDFVLNLEEGKADEPEFSDSGEQPVARQVMNWRITYRRSRTDPSA